MAERGDRMVGHELVAGRVTQFVRYMVVDDLPVQAAEGIGATGGLGLRFGGEVEDFSRLPLMLVHLEGLLKL